MPVPNQGAKVPPKRESMRDVAVRRIRTAIFDGTLLPGERLNDDQLQGWLGMSRTPVREALNDLARLGLVEIAAQSHTRVAIPNPKDRVAVLQTLGALIGGVVRVTTRALTDTQRAEIVTAVELTLASARSRDPGTHGVRVWAMVHLFLDACPNTYLERATRDTIDALIHHVDNTRTNDTTAWDALDEGYPRLREAIVNNDAIAAELAVETVFLLSH